MKELHVAIKGPFALESSFTTHWLGLLEKAGFYTDKISDGSIGKKKTDCYIKTPYNTYLCEIKVIENIILPISRIRPNQRKALNRWNEITPDTGIVCVYSKRNNKYKIFSFSLIAHLSQEESVQIDF